MAEIRRDPAQAGARRPRLRGRRAARRAAAALHHRFARGTVVETEYPVTMGARYGWDDRPPHPLIDAGFAADRARWQARLEALEAHLPALRAIDRTPEGGEPGWENDFFSGLDAVVLYGAIVDRRPRRYVEVGSGHSTTFARRAIRDAGLDTRITSIDPAPRAEIDAICDEVIRAGLEEVGAGPFRDLEPGDVVLIDGSHTCFMGNDGAVQFLEVLPAIPPGVLVGIDDIFLPWDYPPTWVGRAYAEQYLLATLLLAPDPGWTVELPGFWVANDEELAPVVERFRDPVATARFGLGAVTFWMQR
mgnify:CR=1 FL=1